MVEILKLMLGRDSEDKFDQDLCLNFDMNSTLGSVVPLAMFLYNDHLRTEMVLEEVFSPSLCSSDQSWSKDSG